MVTEGIRTWKRISRDPSKPVDARIVETTDPADMSRMIEEADFVTIPRRVNDGEQSRGGYDEHYAHSLSLALRLRFGFSGHVRTSQSGASFVFEKLALRVSGGQPFDFGIEAPPLAMAA